MSTSLFFSTFSYILLPSPSFLFPFVTLPPSFSLDLPFPSFSFLFLFVKYFWSVSSLFVFLPLSFLCPFCSMFSFASSLFLLSFFFHSWFLVPLFSLKSCQRFRTVQIRCNLPTLFKRLWKTGAISCLVQKFYYHAPCHATRIGAFKTVSSISDLFFSNVCFKNLYLRFP